MTNRLLNSLLCRSPSSLQTRQPLLPDRPDAGSSLRGDDGPSTSTRADAASTLSPGAGQPGKSGAASGKARKFVSNMVFHAEMISYVTGLHADMEDRKEAARRINECFQKKTTTLVLDGLQTRDLPNVFHELAHLQHFSHRGCGVGELPSTFASLTNLETLQISQVYGALAERHQGKSIKFPDSLAFPKLKTLALDHCLIEAVPAFIGRCPELTDLSMKESWNIRLPHALAQCTKLDKIDLSDSHFGRDAKRDSDVLSPLWDLCELPSVTKLHMNNLRTAWMDFDEKNHFFSGLEKMSNLKEVDFQQNAMGFFPYRLLKRTKLEEVNFDGNRMYGIRHAHDMPNGCKVSVRGCMDREIELETLISTMRNKKAGEGPTIVFNIPTRVADRPEGGSPDDPPPSRVAPQVVLVVNGQTFKSGKLITLKPGEPAVFEDF